MIFEYCVITFIAFGGICLSCGLCGWIINRVTARRQDRAVRREQRIYSLEIQARAAMVWNQYLTHIQPKHHYEFIHYVSYGEFHGGGSFERAVLTDKMYMAAISAAKGQLSINLLNSV